MSGSLDDIMNEPGQLEYGPHGGTKTLSGRRTKQENARRKKARERLERGLRRRLDFTPEEIEEEKNRLAAEIAQFLADRDAQKKAA
ncbi:hypothetical protein [Sulfitobacter pontiacus]|uniref:hypothetical protein n=1 Tax=Sulfitobacter pontiacus TaxID=60137 RepID=UPI0030EDE629